MLKKTLYNCRRALSRRPFFLLSTCITLLLVAGLDPSIFNAPVMVVDVVPVTPPALPVLRVLSDTDKQYYHDAFVLQKAKQVGEADALLAKVSDPVLKGAFLAERYISADYKAHYEELADWLNHYSDHPQAPALYHLAQNRKPEGATLPTQPEETIALKGFSNGNDKSVLHSSAGGHWPAGLAAYRKHDMALAAEHFRAVLSEVKDLTADDRAAAAFWAYRAFSALGDNANATHYVTQAASEPPSFYSILARRVTGENNIVSGGAESSLEAVQPLLGKAAVKRAIALKEIGQDALAELELRTLFPASDDVSRKQLVKLASLLDLPGAQIRMALEYARGGELEAEDSLYPMPHWMPSSGYHVEPALLFAIMRQESGFNPDAKSASGALGVMQLMPETARAMARAARVTGGSTQPLVSMTLGQTYIERLMQTPSVGDNLVFLAAAYNAGPGTVAAWQHSLHYNDDPLLFIESIPYSETREYVTRVVGNYWVYSELLGGSEVASATALSQGQWPHYTGYSEQISSMLSRLSADKVE